MDNIKFKIPIGLRTVKTAVAVIIAMLVVDLLGTTDSKLIFAMLGAMAAVQPTFKESVEAFLSQIIGVVFGAIAGILLLALRMPPLVTTGIGIILVITLYNILRIRYSPSLPCFILVMLCTTPDVQPLMYALGRIWDTAIGLAIGMLVNMLMDCILYSGKNGAKISFSTYMQQPHKVQATIHTAQWWREWYRVWTMARCPRNSPARGSQAESPVRVHVIDVLPYVSLRNNGYRYPPVPSGCVPGLAPCCHPA